MLYKHGGMWQDLCGAPARGDEGVVLEGARRHSIGTPPPLVFCYGGQRKEKFGGQHGEIAHGFVMSAPGLALWTAVWRHAAEAVTTYPERCRRCTKLGEPACVVDDSLTHFTAPVGMAGR